MKIMATTPISYYQNNQRVNTSTKTQAFGDRFFTDLPQTKGVIKQIGEFFRYSGDESFETMKSAKFIGIDPNKNLKLTINVAYRENGSEKDIQTFEAILNNNEETFFAQSTGRNSSILNEIGEHLFSHST